MKNVFLKLNLELFGLQLFFTVLSFLVAPFFSWIDGWKWIHGIFVGWLFLGAIHSTFWQKGTKERKNIIIANNHLADGEKEKKQKMLSGAIYALPFLAINLIVVLLTFVFDNGSPLGDKLFLVHRIFLFPLAGFIPEEGSVFYWPVCVILCLVMYLPCVTAYISGAHNFSLTEKIVPKIIYKSEKSDNKK